MVFFAVGQTTAVKIIAMIITIAHTSSPETTVVPAYRHTHTQLLTQKEK